MPTTATVACHQPVETRTGSFEQRFLTWPEARDNFAGITADATREQHSSKVTRGLGVELVNAIGQGCTELLAFDIIAAQKNVRSHCPELIF